MEMPALKILPVSLPADQTGYEELLKDHYFQMDPGEYLERRMWGIIAMSRIEKLEDVWGEDDPSSLFSQYSRILGKDMDKLNAPGDTLTTRTLVATESYALMQHSVETLLRLYVVAQEREPGVSPMSKLLAMRSPRAVRDPIKALLDERLIPNVRRLIPHGIFDVNTEDGRNVYKNHLRYLTKWLSFFAEFYSDDNFAGARGNNQLKHGLTVSPRSDLLASFVAATEPPTTMTEEEWKAATAVINADSISYTETVATKLHSEPGYNLRTDNADPATMLALSQVASSICKSLWQVSKIFAYPGVQAEYTFNWSPLPHDLLKRSGKPPRAMRKVLKEPVLRNTVQ